MLCQKCKYYNLYCKDAMGKEELTTFADSCMSYELQKRSSHFQSREKERLVKLDALYSKINANELERMQSRADRMYEKMDSISRKYENSKYV